MKTDIHPTYYPNATVTCACGAVITAGSIIKEQKSEICSECHPFYTGKQKLIDTAGRVDRFKAKMDAAKAHSSGGKDDKKDGKKKDDKYMTIEDIKAIKETGSKKGKAKKEKAPAKETQDVETAEVEEEEEVKAEVEEKAAPVKEAPVEEAEAEVEVEEKAEDVKEEKEEDKK